ncbi:ABC transporter ATP-binding protein [Nocardia wallacei]|uniref:ABC transporter ATP-binding protein n=1 Tax=Nocardia wallacei TaxID=480035 RepID=UPI0024548B51|nr:ABC transporter ATP-binding protein [Nocardia wallacei]
MTMNPGRDGELPEVADGIEAWTAHDNAVRAAGFWAMARKMPVIYGRLLRECFAVGPFETSVIVIGLLVAETMTAVGLLATTDVLTSLLTVGPTPDRVRAAAPGLILVLGALVLRSGLKELVNWSRGRLVPKIQLAVRTRLLNLTTTVELVAFDDREFRDVLHRVRERSPDAACGLLFSGLETASGMIGLAAVGGVVTVLHPVLLPLIFVAIVPTWLASVLSARVVYGVYAGTSGAQRRMDTLAELMSDRTPAAEIRAYGMSRFLLDRFGGLAQRVQEIRLTSENTQAKTRTLGIFLSGVGIGVVYVALTLLLLHGAMPLAVAGTAVIAIRTAVSALSGFSASANVSYENALFYQDYLDFCGEAGKRRERTGAVVPQADTGRIALRDVTFTYPSGSSPALSRVDLDVEPGQIIALVGGNGAGKSTLAKLIAGLYRPDSGSVRYDGVPIDDIDPAWLRDRIAVVPQDFARWPFSARENVTIGRNSQARFDDEFRRVSRTSGAADVFSRLTGGTHTVLDPSYVGGTDLSGGQWQRVAVARGLYKDPAVLIVDEPTAALDAPTERRIFDAIRAGSRGRAVVLITHRMAGVRFADQIYVLDRGRVVERGTHTELMRLGGTYHTFYRLQADLYQDHVDAPPPVPEQRQGRRSRQRTSLRDNADAHPWAYTSGKAAANGPTQPRARLAPSMVRQMPVP